MPGIPNLHVMISAGANMIRRQIDTFCPYLSSRVRDVELRDTAQSWLERGWRRRGFEAEAKLKCE